MLVDAIVLAGGRSSRLGSAPKSELIFEGETLLRRTLRAADAARNIIVVGPHLSESLPVGIHHTRESPPFGGPVAGLAAGMLALTDFSTESSDCVLVLACDMPHIGRAVPALLRAFAESAASDGVIAVDAEQRRQPLAACYRTSRLNSILRARNEAGGPAGMSMFHLLEGLNLAPIAVPPHATADVDTWEDAHRLGATSPIASTNATRAETKETP